MAKSPISSSGSIGLCEGTTNPCVVLMSSTRKDNPVWEGCELVGLKTSVKAGPESSLVTVTIDVKNKGTKVVSGFFIPIQPTSAELSAGKDAEGYTMLRLGFDTLEPGAQLSARGEFELPGRPTGLWIGVQL